MSAQVVRAADAPAYHPPLHDGVDAKRLQGFEVSPTERFWVGESVYHPGGAAALSQMAAETIYYVLEGDLTLTLEGDGEHTLHPGDSVHLPQGTMRAVMNQTDAAARLLVVIAYPNESQDS